MKKLLYVLPILGLLLFTSCSKDESDEIIDETLVLDEGKIEIVENTDNKGFDLIIAPGLYGPTSTHSYTTERYTYFAKPAALNAIPPAKRRYQIQFMVDDLQIGWREEARFDLQSNSVNISFPSYKDYLFTDWHIVYRIYNSDFPDEIKSSKGKTVSVYDPTQN